jgi:CDP-diacylglycerol--serine O-phosphatidyltransferase
MPNREVELRKLIPNLLTAGAFCAGVASIFFAMQFRQDLQNTDMLMRAIGMIGLAFVLDGLDGRLARLLRATSRFGERFDSISDFVCFGLAPAFILYRWVLHSADPAGLQLGFAVVVLYALCAAIRLARFAAQARKKAVNAPVSKFFQGLPAPAAGFIVLIPLLVSLSHTAQRWQKSAGWSIPELAIEWIVLGHTALVAGLMVSTVPMLSVKHIKVRRSILAPLMVAIAVVAIFLVKDAWLTLAVLATGYLLSLPLAVARSKRAPHPSAQPPGPSEG